MFRQTTYTYRVPARFLFTAICLVLIAPFLNGETYSLRAQSPSAGDTPPGRSEQDTRRIAGQDEFLKFLGSLKGGKYRDLELELLTLNGGPTVTTAFGHTALRFRLGKVLGKNDYFVDFGRYDTSPLFLWRFLKGRALFHIIAGKTNDEFHLLDREGRGVVGSTLLLTPEQKLKLVELTEKTIRENRKGYFYNNFTRNCVTYVRDLVGRAAGREIGLKVDAIETPTWRSRVLPYSNKIIWLRINEKLLFDHDTDKPRKPGELIYLPDDLKTALEQNKLLAPEKRWIADRWGAVPQGADWAGYGSLLLFILILLFISPLKRFEKRRRTAMILFALISGLGGLIVTPVWALTTFDFMDGTLMWLVFSPLDFFLLRNPASWENRSIPFYFGLLRLGMVLIALILALTVYLQSILLPLGFSLIFFALFVYNQWRNMNAPLSENPAS